MEAIWDFDGTLFDTYPIMANAMQRALRDEGKAAPAREIEAHMRISMGHAIAFYRDALGLSDETLERYKAYYEEGNPAPFAGVPEVCAAIVHAGGHNHLCTHRGRGALDALQTHGLLPLFSVCVTADDGFPRKPAPDSVQHILQNSNAEKQNFVMVGDRELDILAAHAAGVRACLFANGQQIVETEAEWVLRDFAQFFDVVKEETK